MNNPNNILVTKDIIEDILNHFGGIGNNETRLHIKNLEHYQRAFVHESYHQSVLKSDDTSEKYIDYVPPCSNERLEFFGDHILKAVMGRYLYRRFGEREGDLTKLKTRIEQCSMLQKMSVALGFRKYLLLSLQVENQTVLDTLRGRFCTSYCEDAFEAFVGAIMEDFQEDGYVYADRFVVNVIENVVDFAELNNSNDNLKDSLQRYFQSMKWPTPVYIGIEESGPNYRKIFTRALVLKKEQVDQLNTLQIENINRFTSRSLEYYQTTNKTVYDALFPHDHILCIGKGRKVIDAEQDCASIGLQILELPRTY